MTDITEITVLILTLLIGGYFFVTQVNDKFVSTTLAQDQINL